MLGSTGASIFIRHCLLVTMLTFEDDKRKLCKKVIVSLDTFEISNSGEQIETDLKMES